MNFKHRGVRKIVLLMIPKTFALAIGQINKLVITIIASSLIAGSIAVYNLADNLQHFPIGIFAIPLTVACFPYLSESVIKGEKGKFGIHFSVTFRRIIFLIIPASLFIFFLRAQIVRLILGAGKFSWQDTVLTFQTLGYFSLSLFAQSLIPLLARSFYAFQDTKTPVIISLFSVGLNIVFAVYLGKLMGAPGLALAFSLAMVINFIVLIVALKSKGVWLDDKKILFSTLKIILIGLISAIFLQIAKYLVGSLVDMQTFAGVFVQFCIASAVGMGIYLLLALLLKCEEIEIVRVWIKKMGLFKK